MATLSMPVRLNLGELCAAALEAAADNLAAASDTESFLGALEENHGLWRTLVEVARHLPLDVPASDSAGFVISVSRKCGQGVCDEHVEALIGINRRMSAQLVKAGDPCRIQRRAELAWRETGLAPSVPFSRWLTDEILRKSRHQDSRPESLAG
ncbi:hypothetical protein [Magnetospirillum sp. SS-4]|uniref:hypothetical protein n=1 Tax=Magnetospirillum sp. SS-4 TaxID=2681465 RepID=UPI00137F81A0|nr:hypothetical protein [Magnetospirillum sp. SS-4]CAA7617101.1 conserved hypothetical protein [Magnetospirillum sp. SS-4]